MNGYAPVDDRSCAGRRGHPKLAAKSGQTIAHPLYSAPVAFGARIEPNSVVLDGEGEGTVGGGQADDRPRGPCVLGDVLQSL
jgi:hypothetical protein